MTRAAWHVGVRDTGRRFHRIEAMRGGTTRAITLQLDWDDYERLVAEAQRLGMSASDLGEVYLRTALDANSGAMTARDRQAGLAALMGLAALRKRLPAAGPVDVVELIRTEREKLDQRTVW